MDVLSTILVVGCIVLLLWMVFYLVKKDQRSASSASRASRAKRAKRAK